MNASDSRQDKAWSGLVQQKLIIQYTNSTKDNSERIGSDQRWYWYTTVYNQ